MVIARNEAITSQLSDILTGFFNLLGIIFFRSEWLGHFQPAHFPLVSSIFYFEKNKRILATIGAI